MNSDKTHDNIQSTTVTSSVSLKTSQLSISDNSSWFTFVRAFIFSDLFILVRILAVSLPHSEPEKQEQIQNHALAQTATEYTPLTSARTQWQ